MEGEDGSSCGLSLSGVRRVLVCQINTTKFFGVEYTECASIKILMDVTAESSDAMRIT